MKNHFEWDLNKEASNIRKHGVSFEEAAMVFYDPNALYRFDQAHSTRTEDREICLGLSRHLVLVVIFTERQNGSRYRIISARRANRKELNYYYENQT